MSRPSRSDRHPGLALGIFAKAPQPGQVKTRLCPPLTPDEAAQLYAVMLTETVTRLTAAALDPTLFYAGDGAYFRAAFPALPQLDQGPGDLGDRLERAFARLFAQGAQLAMVIGSDSPDLPLSLIDQAVDALTRHEAVIAPAGDGGYVLLGSRRHRPELLANIPWSTPQVLAITRRRAQDAGIDCGEVATWDDVDDLPSLSGLLRRSPDSATAAFVRTGLVRLLPTLAGCALPPSAPAAPAETFA